MGRSAQTRGFRTASSRAINVTDWFVDNNRGFRKVSPHQMDDWQYSDNITVQATIRLDREQLRHELGLPSTSEVGLAIIWHSAGTLLRGSSDSISANSEQVIVQLPLAGEFLHQKISFTVQLTLRALGSGIGEDFTATEVGSLLWESPKYELQLEDTSPQMPLLSCSFKSLGWGGEGLWSFEIAHSELEAPAASAFRVFLNEDSNITEALTSPSAGPQGNYLLQIMQAEISRQIIEFGLAHEDFDPQQEYPVESLGSAVSTTFRMISENRAHVENLARNDNSRLVSLLQSVHGGTQ